MDDGKWLVIRGAWQKHASQEVDLKKKKKKFWQDYTSSSHLILSRNKSCSCPCHCMTDARKDRHGIFASHYSQERQNLWRADWQISHQTCLLQHSSSLPHPGLLLKPPLIHLPSTQWPVLAFKPEDVYFRLLPQRHQGEQTWLRKWLAKTGRRKKHAKAKSRICRGAEPADKLLQTTSMLPQDPQPPSKKLCSLLTSLAHKRQPQLPTPSSSHL